MDAAVSKIGRPDTPAARAEIAGLVRAEPGIERSEDGAEFCERNKQRQHFDRGVGPAEDAVADAHFDREALLVILGLAVANRLVAGGSVELGVGPLLERGLGVAAHGVALLADELSEDAARECDHRPQSAVEIHRAEYRLEAVRKNRVLLLAAGEALGAAEHHVGAEVELAGDCGERRFVDQ